MASGPTIVAKFVADTNSLTTGVDSATAGAESKLGGFAKRAAGMLAGAFALNKVVDFAKGTVDAASDLNESMSKVGVVFGASGDRVLKWSESAATAMGLSQQKALEAAGTYGNLAVAIGLPQDSAANMSTSLVKLAGDLASFNNVPVDEALGAIRSGLTGETEPLKKFGVNMNEATLKAKAMEMGLSDGKGTLDASAKAQAAYALMMAQTGTAQGDFARTSDGLANSQRIASAQFEDMQAKIGSKLLPVMLGLTTFVTGSLLPAFEAIGSWIADHKEVVLAALIGVGTVVGLAVIPAFITWAAAAGAAAVATLVAAAPFIALGAIIAGIAYLIITNWDAIRAGAQVVWDFVLNAVQTVWQWISDNWPLLLTILTGPIGLAVALIVSHWDKIKAAASAVWQWVTDRWTEIGAGIGVITGAVSGFMGDMARGFGVVQGAATTVHDWVTGKFQAIADTINGIVGAVGAAATAVADAIRAPINAIVDMWNGMQFRVPTITLPSWDVPGDGTIGGGTIGGQTFDFPDLPRLARGGVLRAPTLFLGGEAGTEVVAPEALLRTIVAEEAGSGAQYVMNVYPRTVDPADVAYAFRRLELMAGTS